ncbi:tetratricopeptide repeat protein [Desulforapulum autotrophicum]|nr:tetratricopeptide repeat protein [Desulforapulum autotrophicum]
MTTARIKFIGPNLLPGVEFGRDRQRLPWICLHVVLVLAFLGAGCTQSPKIVKAVESKAIETPAMPAVKPAVSAGEEIEASSYYYYTRSELYKRTGEFDKSIDELLKAVKIDPESSFLMKELIALYLHKKDTTKALETAQDLVAIDPEDTDSLFILAKLKQMLNQISEATDIYQKILQLNPDQENAYLPLGQIYMDADNMDEAFNLYTNMVKHVPDSYAAHFFLGRIHIIRNNPEYAEKEFLKTIKLHPELLEPRFELINIYQTPETKDSIPRIIKLYNEILEIDENNIQAGLELPLFYHYHGEEDKASDMLAAIGKKNMEDPSFIRFASRELLGNKRFNDAAIVFTGMLKGAPEDSTLEFLAGVSYDSLKLTRKAIHHFLKVKPDSEYYKKSIVHIAFSYNENEQTEKAIGFLEVKHRELPEDMDIITYLAAFYEGEEAYEKSINLLNEGINLYPDAVDLFFRLGVVQDKFGQKQACIQSMKRAIELDPDNANALNYLGYTYADLGENLDVAKSLILKALSLKPDDGFITDSLGWVYYKKAQFAEAVSVLEKAVQLTQGDPVIIEHLGDAYQKDNRLEKALEAYKKARSKSKTAMPDLDAKIRNMEEQLNGPR